MAHIKIGRDTNGNKNAKLVTDAGSFKIQVNQTSELSSAFYGFYKGDKITVGDIYGAKAVRTLFDYVSKNGTARQKKIIAVAGG